MKQAELLTTDLDGVRTLTLNRPERRNALSGSLVVSLIEALHEAGRDSSVRVIVLRGAGAGFCAGGDLGSNSGAGGGILADQEGRLTFVELLDAFSLTGKPTIASVHGKALGGGFGLVLACDLAIASACAELGTPEVRVGLFPMMILPLIVRHMGRKRALELVLTGGRLTAASALEAGCLNKVVQDDQLEEATNELAGRLTAFSPAVHRLGLRHFHDTADLPIHAAATAGASVLGLNLMLDDAAEGIAAFLARRPPEWNGR